MLGDILLVLAISIDTLIVSVAYSTRKIKIPIYSMITMNLTSILLLVIGLLGGNVIKDTSQSKLVEIIGAVILIIIGLYQLFSYLSSKDEAEHINIKRVLGLGEALVISIVLSIDGLGVGIAIAMGTTNNIIIVTLFSVVNMLSIITGILIGNKLSKNKKFDISWVSSLILIFIGLFKYFTI